MAQLTKFDRQREVTRGAYVPRFTKQRLHVRGRTTTTLPTLTSISPTTAEHSTPTTVTCTGTNYVTGITRVTVATPATATSCVDQPTTFVSATSVTFVINAPAAGTYGVLVHNGEKFSTVVRTFTATNPA